MKKLAAIAILSALLLGSAAHSSGCTEADERFAEDKKHFTTYEKCMEESRGVTVDMRDCDCYEDDRLEKKKAQLLKTMTQKLKAGEKEHLFAPGASEDLMAAEKKWEEYTRAECDFAVSSDPNYGGTAALLTADGCGLEHDEMSVKLLEKHLKEIENTL